MSMADLLAQSQGKEALEKVWYDIPFPSLDNLHEACGAIDRTRDMTSGLEKYFLSIKDSLKFVLDPLTQPLSWMSRTHARLQLPTMWTTLSSGSRSLTTSLPHTDRH